MLRIKGLPSQATPAILFSAVILLGVLATSLYFWYSTFEEQRWLEHTFQVLLANRTLLSDVRDAESGQRGYLLTGDPSYLEPYTQGSKAAPANLERLRSLTSDNPTQQKTLQRLGEAVTSKLDELNQTIVVAEKKGIPAALDIVKTNYGRDTMESIRILSAEVATEEEHLRLQRSATLDRKQLVDVGVSGVFLLMALTLAWWLVNAYRQLNSVLECTTDSVINIRRDWTILYGNRNAFASLPGLKIGANYWKSFPAMLEAPEGELLRATMRERTPAQYEMFYAPYQRSYKVEAFPSSEGISIFFSENTEERKLQQQLAQEQFLREHRVEALSNMAGGLAHEISNPLAIIYARASDLKSRALEPSPPSAAEILKACDSIVKTADRASSILKGLKGFTRVAGKDSLESTSIYRILEECLLLQQSRFLLHNIELRTGFDSDIPGLLCRETQIRQIVTNLLNNAFDAVAQGIPAQRWVSLDAHGEKDRIFVDVTDGGPGIEPQFKAHLMEPFFTTKSVGGGIGIGLSLSHAIAVDHGGDLILRSDTANTSFRLTIPYHPPAEVTANGSHAQAGSGHPMHSTTPSA